MAFVGVHLLALVSAIVLTVTRQESRDKEVIAGVGIVSAGLVAGVAAFVLRARNARMIRGELPRMLDVRDAMVLSFSLQVAPLGGLVASKMQQLQESGALLAVVGFVGLIIVSAIWRPLVLEGRAVVAGVIIAVAGLAVLGGAGLMVSSVRPGDLGPAQAGTYVGAFAMFVCTVGSIAIGVGKIVGDEATRRRMLDVARTAYSIYLLILGGAAGMMSMPDEFRANWILKLHKKFDDIAEGMNPNLFFLSFFALYSAYLLWKATRPQSIEESLG